MKLMDLNPNELKHIFFTLQQEGAFKSPVFSTSLAVVSLQFLTWRIFTADTLATLVFYQEKKHSE
jgi:hypothetical protein